MKRSIQCPKRGSHDILLVAGSISSHSGTSMRVHAWSSLSATPIDRCICGGTEEWIDMKYVDKLKKQYL